MQTIVFSWTCILPLLADVWEVGAETERHDKAEMFQTAGGEGEGGGRTWIAIVMNECIELETRKSRPRICSFWQLLGRRKVCSSLQTFTVGEGSFLL